MILASHLTKIYRRRGGQWFRAVDDIDLALLEGELFGVVGRSGSGKTTLGMMLCGAIPPTSGVVRREPAAGHPLRCQMVFQNPSESLDPRMTAGESITEPLVIQRLAAAPRKLRFEEAVEMARLDATVLKHYPHELSGGECQRVAIARALAARPELIVADEPTSMLDGPVASEILEILRRLKASSRLIVVLISHDVAQAAHVCDRIAVMDTGKIQQVGQPKEILRSPATEAVLRLIEAARARDRLLRFAPG